MLRSPSHETGYASLSDIAATPNRPSPSPIPPAGTQTIFTGTSGDDNYSGTSGADEFKMAQAGHDTVFGNGGDDAIHFGHYFGVNDTVRGGSGSDTLFLSGAAYAGGLSITGAMLQGVEEIDLGAGYDYSFTVNDFVVAAGAQLYVNGYFIGAGHSLFFDGEHETNGSFNLAGSYGDDVLIGGSQDDEIHSSPYSVSGGDDFLLGQAGNDIFVFGPDFTSADKVYGSAGLDALSLDGDYSAGVTLGADVLGVEQLTLIDGNSYRVNTLDVNVGATSTFTVNATSLSAGYSLTFNGATEGDGYFHIYGGAGDDIVTGGSQDDTIDFSLGGKDTGYGGAGDDLFQMEDKFSGKDSLHGGAGYDTVQLSGKDYSLSLTASEIADIEEIRLFSGNNYTIATADNAVGAGDALTLSGESVDSLHAIGFDGSAETNGAFLLFGGHGADTLTGGAHGDSLQGNEGGDTLNGGAGGDLFAYQDTDDSTSTEFDIVTGFDADADGFFVASGVSSVDGNVTSGALSQASFDSDVANAIGAGQLGAGHAVLFKPSSGGYAGTVFLIVDANGTAGYQGGEDYVIELNQAAHLHHLDAGNFF